MRYRSLESHQNSHQAALMAVTRALLLAGPALAALPQQWMDGLLDRLQNPRQVRMDSFFFMHLSYPIHIHTTRSSIDPSSTSCSGGPRAWPPASLPSSAPSRPTPRPPSCPSSWRSCCVWYVDSLHSYSKASPSSLPSPQHPSLSTRSPTGPGQQPRLAHPHPRA